jgi:hypothetical protein
MKNICIYFFIILNLTCVFAFTPNFSEINYYGEVIDIGLRDLNFSKEAIIKITILNDYEVYFVNSYSFSEIDNVPVILDTQVSSDAKVVYEIYIDSNKIEEKEFNLNLSSIEALPNFFFCLSLSCEQEEISKSYDFWAEDTLYLSANEDLEKYSVAISIDSENNTLLFDNNITLPYEIPKNLIVGYANYTLNIELTDKETNRLFNQKLEFSLNELTREEHKEIMFEILDIDVNEDKDTEEIVDINYLVNSSSSKQTLTQRTESKSRFNSLFVWLLVGIIIFIVIIMLAPKSKRRRKKL